MTCPLTRKHGTTTAILGVASGVAGAEAPPPPANESEARVDGVI
jgi:hypothetical protein